MIPFPCISRSLEHDPDDIASTVGIMQALISVFLDDGDKLRCINAGGTRINILMRPPLYYACVSSWGEPESVVSLGLAGWDTCAHALEERPAPISSTCTCRS